MKKRQILIVAAVLFTKLYSWSQLNSKVSENSKYVNPFIGTGSIDSLSLSGSNFPGAVFPFGFVQLSPDTDAEPEDPCSGYDYADNRIVGFSHTHLSGTGVADLFDFLFMPFKGEPKWYPYDSESEKGYSSIFDHKNEIATPGYYSVFLDDQKIKVELTATEHCGIHRYMSEGKEPFSLIIDLNHSLDKKRPYWSCKVIDAQIKIINNHIIEGYRTLTGWANLRKVYFRAEFSKAFNKTEIKSGNRIYLDEKIANHQNLKTIITFDNNEEPLVVKVGISSVSYEGAQENLKAEIKDFNFNEIRAKTENQWNKELSVIEIEGTEEQKKIFYTSLYHTFIHPNNIADVNGNYINSNGELRNSKEKKYYSTFSLWDTYRAEHPLLTIIQEKRSVDFINSMLDHYMEYGYLPIWQLWGKETYCMIGNHAIPVIVDAYHKKIPNIDYNLAYKAINASSTISHQNSAFNILEKYQYIPEDLESQSVSITLEIAYNDWCVAQMAKGLGYINDYTHFNNRSEFYQNLFDYNIGFFRAKDSIGNWIEPFAPLKYGGNGGSPFTEGNAWQYLWYVPQDIYTFMNMLGGEKQFIDKLDEFFTLDAKPSDVNGNASGFIGQYAHGNEPSHHIAYLYDYAGQPWKSQYYTNRIVNDLYSSKPSGYSGNEDCGQMSAWYIFSSMGFYPVNPANNVYVFGSPQLNSAVIKLSKGKKFEIITHERSDENIYIQKILLNGKPYKKIYIKYQDIIIGGKIEFFMGSKPNRNMVNYDKPPLLSF